MKTLLTLAASLTLSCAAAMAQPTTIPTPTRDWGCEVLLCLANPAGPTAVAECVPPIRRLWRHLAKGRAFPTCAMATGSEGRSYARPAYRYYDPCPNGTMELGRGDLAELAVPMASTATANSRSGSATAYAPAVPGYTYVGVETRDGHGMFDTDGNAPWKICAANHQGTRDVWSGDTGYSIDLYGQIYVAPAHASPNVIDVYVDNVLWHSVRW